MIGFAFFLHEVVQFLREHLVFLDVLINAEQQFVDSLGFLNSVRSRKNPKTKSQRSHWGITWSELPADNFGSRNVSAILV